MTLGNISMPVSRLAAAVLLAGLHLAAHAGNGIIASRIPGYFIGYADQHRGRVLLAANNPKPYLDEIRKTCDRHGQLWALGARATFHCTGFEYQAAYDGGDSDAGTPAHYRLELSVEGAKTPDDLGAPVLLFALKPFPAYKWEPRTATAAEIRGVTALFANDKKDFPRARDAFSSDNVRVMDTQDRKATIFILQLAIAPEDGNPINAVVVKENGKFRIAARVAGTILGVVDVDGDGMPELLISQADFGSSEFLLSLKSGRNLIWDTAFMRD